MADAGNFVEAEIEDIINMAKTKNGDTEQPSVKQKVQEVPEDVLKKILE